MSVLVRGLQLLDHMADLGEVGVTELSQRIGADPSQTYRALRVLQKCGYVEQDPDTRKYQLSSHIVELASSHLKRLDVRTAALPVLRGLAKQTRHTAHLAVLSRDYAVIIEQVRGASSVSVNLTMGDIAPLHATALGKALLAHIDPARCQAIVDDMDYKAMTPHSLCSKEQLCLELGETRSRGFAIDDEEAFPGIRCAAAPVFNWSGSVIAAIGVSGPAWEIDPAMFVSLGHQVLTGSSELSKKLGYLPDGLSSVNATAH